MTFLYGSGITENATTVPPGVHYLLTYLLNSNGDN